MQTFEAARERLIIGNYQLVPIQGEPLFMVFWPPDKENHRRFECLSPDEVMRLASTVPTPGEIKGRPAVDVQRIGIVGMLKKAPMTTNADGDPVLHIVFEIVGRNAVNTIPIEGIRDMLGQSVLFQMHSVQMRLNWEKSDRVI